MAWAAAAGAGASLAGSVLSFIGGNNANEQAARNMQMQVDLQRELATRSEYLQQLFASNQLQWRAQDARNAGIHPVFAMGAQPIMAQGYSGSVTPSQPINAMEGFAQMGQDLGRAAIAVMDHEERKQALSLNKERLALDVVRQASEIDRTNAEAEYFRSQSARLRGQVGPPFPSLGGTSPGGARSGDAVTSRFGTYETDPLKVTTANPLTPTVGAGPAGPTVQFNWSTSGALQPFPAQGLKIEDEFLAPLMTRWLMTEVVPSNLGLARGELIEAVKQHMKAKYPTSVGFEWSHLRQGWMPLFKGDRPARSVGDTRHPRGWYSGGRDAGVHRGLESLR